MSKRQSSSSLLQNFFANELEDSESDSDFKVEDHDDNSDFDDDGSTDSDASDAKNSESDKSSDEEILPKKSKADDSCTNRQQQATASTSEPVTTTEKLAEYSKLNSSVANKLLTKAVCCACLGDWSDDSNEIVECDGCKITVHEGCYGVSESVSVSSTISSCSTEPWFCEACRANIKDPDCELCPNRGGIFKETDCGKWVHLVCALYVPGVAFGEVDQLTSVTLFEMQYSKWGAKPCSLCDDDRFARTGVCIGCDAGMCKTYFHVTCAQKAGLLSEAHHEEVDHADPFYAHCKLHSDKTQIKHRKRNYNALLMQMEKHKIDLEMGKSDKSIPELERIDRKLKKHRIKYTTNKINRIEPWVPTQKIPRMINTSASACKKLMKKTDLMGIDAAALEFQEAQIASLTDIRKKWHIPPAFSTEFVGYYLDRSIRMKELKTNLDQQMTANKTLLSQQQILRTKYDDSIKIKEDIEQRHRDLLAEIEQLHGAILTLVPQKQLQNLEKPAAAPVPFKTVPSPMTPTLSSTPPPQMITNRTMSVPTAAARKMGVGFPLNNLSKDDTGRILSTQCELLNECGICKKCTEQHLLAKCDTCHLYYHLGCLNPPLTRHPKKSKLYMWQCSECDKSDDSAPENVIIPKGPRRSRIRYSKDGFVHSDVIHDSFGSEKSSRKSSPHRTLNGSGNGIDVKSTPEISINVPPMVLSEETTKVENLSSTSVLIVGSTKDKNPRKRGRKSKNKQSQISSVETSPLPTATSLQAMSLIKETPMENHLPNDLNEIKVENEQLTPASIEAKQNTTLQLSSDLPKNYTKKGRPRKEKRSLMEISQELQKQQELNRQQQQQQEHLGTQIFDDKPEVTVLDLRHKTEHPLDNFRQFSDIKSDIPYESSTMQLPKIVDEPEIIPALAETVSEKMLYENYATNLVLHNEFNGVVDQPKYLNGDTGDGTLDYTTSGSGHHKHKKRKSHKRHHSHSPSSGDRQSSSKKHKRKHKHKESESKLDGSLSDVRPVDEPIVVEKPPLKLKLTAFMPAGGAKNSKVLWRTSDGNELTLHPIETQKNSSLDEIYSSSDHLDVMKSPTNGHHEVIKKREKQHNPNADKTSRLLFNLSPNKTISSPVISASQFTASASSTPTSVATVSVNKSLPLPSQICDVCQIVGSNQNLVKCDECQKNYHYLCLMPPLKKTPKKRGYSWHCADCDPTDRENN